MSYRDWEIGARPGTRQYEVNAVALAYQVVCDMYAELYSHGIPPSLEDIDAARRFLQLAMTGPPADDERAFRQRHGIG